MSALFVCLTCLSACHQVNNKDQHLLVEFVPFYADKAINCDGIFYHNEAKWQINTLSFFVSKPIIQNSQTPHPLNFVNSQWQTANVALLWFANTCEADSAENRALTLTLESNQSITQASTFTFSLAIPFAQNHANPLLQRSPLNISEMFWSWRNGHKFMRFDASKIETSDHWSLHLGSLGCQSQSSLRAPIKPCETPNVVDKTVSLNTKNLKNRNINRLTLKFDIALLVKNIELTQSNSCMFDYNQQNQCNIILENLANNPIFSVVKTNE